ncbi:hypothetical protein QQG55_17885 [Brugia pahangi]|uniref:DUF2179 domain-containing protein n=1 Tax=Brugia pahangi TaxID=6280 RepID=A0A0N4T959_BRUPA|nr:unnamed protein product [Brugia pahangi]
MEVFPVTTVIDVTIKFIRHHKIHLVKKVVFYNIEWRQYVFVISDESVTKIFDGHLSILSHRYASAMEHNLN